MVIDRAYITNIKTHDAYMSYWHGGYQQTPDETVLKLHKICNYFLNKHFLNVHLITDSNSINFFKDLNWTSVSTDLDCLEKYKELSKDKSGIWSLGKVLAYQIASKKNKPFVHVDYDVVLWKGLPKYILDAEVFSQCEEDWAYTEYDIPGFLKNCPFPYAINNIKKFKGANMGIFGGKNLEFISKYAEDAFNLATDNRNFNFFKSHLLKNDFSKACIIEQYYLACFAHKENIKITYFGNWDEEISNWFVCHENKGGFSHFMRMKEKEVFKSCLNNILDKYKIF